MLTKTDLSQISGIVTEAIDNRVTVIIEKQLKPIIKDIYKIKKDLKLVTNYFDKKYINHDIRITQLEKHVGINSSQLA